VLSKWKEIFGVGQLGLGATADSTGLASGTADLDRYQKASRNRLRSMGQSADPQDIHGCCNRRHSLVICIANVERETCTLPGGDDPGSSYLETGAGHLFHNGDYRRPTLSIAFYMLLQPLVRNTGTTFDFRGSGRQQVGNSEFLHHSFLTSLDVYPSSASTPPTGPCEKLRPYGPAMAVIIL
jgi:hypothetical protein